MCPHRLQQTGIGLNFPFTKQAHFVQPAACTYYEIIFHFEFSSVDKLGLHVTREYCAADTCTNFLSVNVTILLLYSPTILQNFGSWSDEISFLVGSNFIDKNIGGKNCK